MTGVLLCSVRIPYVRTRLYATRISGRGLSKEYLKESPDYAARLPEKDLGPTILYPGGISIH